MNCKVANNDVDEMIKKINESPESLVAEYRTEITKKKFQIMLFNIIVRSVENVFESNFRTKEIAEKTGLSYTTVSDLRTGVRDLQTTSVEKFEKLYKFSILNDLNENFNELDSIIEQIKANKLE